MSRFNTCGLTILLAFAPAALAVDGTVLINQSTITNGLTGCPTGGHFPIIICQSGSYRLSGNIIVPDANTTAVQINTDNVTLDLNGFAILGPVTCKPGTYPVQCSTKGFGIGIFSLFNKNISVTNGTITGMGSTGVFLPFSTGRIDGLRVSNNAGANPDQEGGGGIVLFEGVISNCTVTTNALHGIGLVLGTVTQNDVSTNGGNGITSPVVGGAEGSIVASNNSVTQNGQDGIHDVLLAVNNILNFNIGFGLSCDDTSCGFEGNVFKNNGGIVSNGTSLGHNFSNGKIF